MKTKKKLSMLTILVVTILIYSCTKEAEVIPKPTQDKEEISSEMRLKRSYPVGLYGVNKAYKNAYYHLKQYHNECSWTSYVLTAASIIRGKGNLNYPNNAGGYRNKISHCKSWCNNSSYITKLQNYCNYVDKNAGYPISCTRMAINKNHDLSAAYAMLNHISNHHSPFLYIGSVNNIGHYYIVWSIYWGGSLANSDIWYTNTLSNNGTFYSMNLQSFLDLNIMNYHNMLFIYGCNIHIFRGSG